MILINIYLTVAYWLANAAYLVFAFIPFLIVALFSREKARSFANGWGKLVINILFLKKSFRGFENIPQQSVLIASNHTSMLDIHLTIGYLPIPFHFLMKESLFRIPILGISVKILGFFPINRTNARRAYETLQNVASKMKEGASVLVYPEGTRNRNDELLPFKSGFVRLAAMAQVPILPVYVHGCKEVNRGATKLFHYHPVGISVGKPINPPQNDSKEELQRVSDEVRVALELLRNN